MKLQSIRSAVLRALLYAVVAGPLCAQAPSDRLAKRVVPIATAAGAQILALGDIDQDGVEDFAVSALPLAPASGTGPQAVTAIGGETGQVLWTTTAPFAFYGENIFSAGDRDGDGIEDIGTLGSQGRNQVVWIQILSGASGTILSSVPTDIISSTEAVELRAARVPDRTGDGLDEVCFAGGFAQIGIVFPLPSVHSPFILDASTGRLVASSTVRLAPAPGPIASGVDLNADGIPEIAIGHPDQWTGAVTMHDGATLNPLWTATGLTPGGRLGNALLWPRRTSPNRPQVLIVGDPGQPTATNPPPGKLVLFDASTGAILGEGLPPQPQPGFGHSIVRRRTETGVYDWKVTASVRLDATQLTAAPLTAVAYMDVEIGIVRPVNLTRPLEAASSTLAPGLPELVVGTLPGSDTSRDLYALFPGAAGTARLVHWSNRVWRSFGAQPSAMGEARLTAYDAGNGQVYGLNLSSTEAGPTPYLLVLSHAPIARQPTPFGTLYTDPLNPSALMITGTTGLFGTDPSYLGNFATTVPASLRGDLIAQGAVLDFDTPGWVLLSNGLRITL